MLPPFVWILFAAALGLIVGSFLNVVVYRVPRGQSVVTPRSACPWCGGAIGARDNIPLLGYLLLRGRCRRCNAPIGWRYPAVEATVAGLFALCVARFGPRPQALVAAVICAFLVALALIDVDHLMLPDSLTFPGMLIAFALAVPAAFDHSIALVGPLWSALGMLCGAGFLFLVAEAWLWLRGEEGLGLGDAKMMAMIGAFLGWRGCVETMIYACFAGTAVGLVLLATGRAGRRTRLPFGVFLALGALGALFGGPAVLQPFLPFL
ncbi:MAG: A24 family peptidase [Acidobacteriota bacterium]